VRLAERIAQLPRLDAPVLFAAIRHEARREWRRQGFFRLLNRMLFLAGEPDARWRVMQRFYGLPAGLVERFYAGRLTRGDMARILTGKPPVPLVRALDAALRIHPHQIRTTSA
jgi:lycopene beta-cyclase